MCKCNDLLPVPDGVDVWIVTLRDDNDIHSDMLTSDEDRFRYGQIVPPRKRRNFVFRRAVRDYVLKRYVNKYTINRCASGKPYVCQEEQKQPICFSASASVNVCVIAVSKTAIGIDIENRDYKVDLIGICERFVPDFAIKKHRWEKTLLLDQIAMSAWCRFEALIKLRNHTLHEALIEDSEAISAWTYRDQHSEVLISDNNYVCAVSQLHPFNVDHVYAMQYEDLYCGRH